MTPVVQAAIHWELILHYYKRNVKIDYKTDGIQYCDDLVLLCMKMFLISSYYVKSNHLARINISYNLLDAT